MKAYPFDLKSIILVHIKERFISYDTTQCIYSEHKGPRALRPKNGPQPN